MSDVGDLRWVVRDGIESEDGGPCEEWWVYQQVLVSVEPFEPGLPLLDEDWRDDDTWNATDGYFNPIGPFDSVAEAAAECRRRRLEYQRANL